MTSDDPRTLFLSYGLEASYDYKPIGEKGARVIVLQVRETDQSFEEATVPALRLTPKTYKAQLLIDPEGLVVCVEGEGITAALAAPQKFAQWVKETFAYMNMVLAPYIEKWQKASAVVATLPQPKTHETNLRVGHRDVPDPRSVSRAVPRGGTPPALELF